MSNLLKSFILLASMLVVLPSFAVQPPDEFAKSGISVGVVVQDLNKALDFYINVIGMTKTGEFSVDATKAKELGLSDGNSFDVKVLKLENSENAPEWKLMSFGRKASHPKPTYVPDDNGVQYITVFVKSMKPFLERIQKHGVKMLGKTPTMLDANRQFVLVQDPDGTFIELIGPK
ncbi:MAG: VOC family protein [Prolixibacteraceae bacterium]|nr:VOC family protein [Prolixibacteraceae bacterium]